MSQTPPDPDDVLGEAERLLDANDFGAARDAYRSAVRSGVLTRAALANLEVATEQERLAFARELREHHPGSLEAGLGLAHTLAATRRFDDAVALCTTLLAEQGADGKAALQIRIVRLQASARSQRHDHLVDDARAIWTEGESRPALRRLHRTLLRALAGIEDAEAEQALHSIAATMPDGPERRFVASKAAELSSLADALRQSS